MSNPRTGIEDLRLANSPNLKRALKYPPQAKKNLAKKAELEDLWTELYARYVEALADIKENGMMVFQDRSHAGKIFAVRVVNPVLKVVQQTERQLVQLAKHLERYPADDDKPKTANDVLADLDKVLAGVN